MTKKRRQANWSKVNEGLNCLAGGKSLTLSTLKGKRGGQRGKGIEWGKGLFCLERNYEKKKGGSSGGGGKGKSFVGRGESTMFLESLHAREENMGCPSSLFFEKWK